MRISSFPGRAPVRAVPVLAVLGFVLAAVGAAAQSSPVMTRMPFPQGVARVGADPVYEERDVGAERIAVQVGGRERAFHLYAPNREGPRPAVLLLHGAGRSGLSMIDMWKATADREGLVLIAPDSAGRGWDLEADPPELFQAALNGAARRAPMDPARLYIFGHSAGGRLALLFANRLPGAWRAAAVHAGFLGGRAVAPAEGAPPVLMVVGEHDRLAPPAAAMATARALGKGGHEVKVVEILDHTHWFYEIGPWVSGMAWEFFEAQRGAGAAQ